jgi:hypothetical protein
MSERIYAMAPRRNGGERRVKVLSYDEQKKHFKCFFRENGSGYIIFYELEDLTPIVVDSHHQPLLSDNQCQPFLSDSHPQPLLSHSHHQPLFSDSHHQPLLSDNHHQPLLSDSHHQPCRSCVEMTDMCSMISTDVSSLMSETIVSDDRSSPINTQFDDSIKEDFMGVPDQSKEDTMGVPDQSKEDTMGVPDQSKEDTMGVPYLAQRQFTFNDFNDIYQFVRCFFLLSLVVFTVLFYFLFFFTVIERTEAQDKYYKNCLENRNWFCSKKDFYSIYLETIAEFVTKLYNFIFTFIIFFVADNVRNIFCCLFYYLF